MDPVVGFIWRMIVDESTEKNTHEEQGGVYVGVWAAPTPLVDLAVGLEQEGTGSIPSVISLKYEHELPPVYAKLARLIGTKRADGSQIEVPDEW